MLFAGYDLIRVTISSADGLIVGAAWHAARARVVVALAGDSIAVDGVPMRQCTLRARDGGAAEVAIEGRSRMVRGTLLCVRDGGEIRLTARIAIRDYLAATLSTEASASDPLEYLTALSVLQRNYLAGHAGRHAPVADLCDNTHCQRADAREATLRIYEAVDRAARIGLDADSSYPCYYSVNCGGSTLTPAQVWKRAEPGYSNVHCTYCRNSPRYHWERTAAAVPAMQGLMRSAPAAPFVDDDFKIRLGRVIGFNKVLSNTIDRIERRGPVYVIAGRGFGHRIGMCQEGARQLALHGWKADAILRFYFPAAHVSLRR